ncbi:hypothetical protein [Streptomyces sp. NPDC002057]|uniref:hypothetical protein n=1 Tax=Streptomyces sp. NPDC002057 TaxID=3154664 RepID=UPI003328B61E
MFVPANDDMFTTHPLPDGLWHNASVCGCTSGCSCGQLCEVALPGPVYDVTSLDVNGAVLVPEAYRVDAPGRLVRTDGERWRPAKSSRPLPDRRTPSPSNTGGAWAEGRTGIPLVDLWLKTVDPDGLA